MKKLVFIIILFLQFNNVNSQESELYHKVKINYISSENFEKLLESGIPLDHGIHKKNSYFESDFSESEIQAVIAVLRGAYMYRRIYGFRWK